MTDLTDEELDELECAVRFYSPTTANALAQLRRDRDEARAIVVRHALDIMRLTAERDEAVERAHYANGTAEAALAMAKAAKYELSEAQRSYSKAAKERNAVEAQRDAAVKALQDVRAYVADLPYNWRPVLNVIDCALAEAAK